MNKIKIAIQGELGAYSHIAAERLYKDADIKTCSTFEETFRQAYNNTSYKIVIPIEKMLINGALLNDVTELISNDIFLLIV